MSTPSWVRVTWPIPPDIVSRIRTQIAETGEPEAIPELHPGPLSKKEPFRIHCEISIPRGRRVDGRLAPCPMCQPNKFLDGRLVWFGRLEAIAVIGHCCADQEISREAEREFRAREAKERATNFVLDALIRLPELRDEYESLAPRAMAAQTLFDRFRHDGAAFQTALRQATKNGGELTVSEVIGPRSRDGPAGLRTAGSTVDTRDVQFGTLTGLRALATRCRANELLKSVHEVIAALASITDDATTIEFLEGLLDSEILGWEKRLRNAQSKLIELRALVDDIASFFTEENARRISKWGSHRDAPMRITANWSKSRIRNRFEFELVGWPSGRRVGLLLPPELFGAVRPRVEKSM